MSAVGFAALTGIAAVLARVMFDRWSVATGSGATPGGPVAPDQLLVLGAAGAALVLAGWLILGTVAAVVAHLPGRVGLLAEWVAEHWAPALSRRVAAAIVGAATMGSLTPAAGIAATTPPAATATGAAATATGAAATAAGAPTTEAPPRLTAEHVAPTDLPSSAPTADGPGFTRTAPFTSTMPFTSTGSPAADQAEAPGWVPTRPAVPPVASPQLLTSTLPKAHSDGEIVVHRDDTLWDIARRHLGPRASDAEVAQAWPRWYSANRAVIGADPGRLLPGQILVAPGPRPPRTPGADRQAHR